ncbi:hypothetical protein [Endozoicomonas sp. SCSIO W0465]|uniref:hypothetical protein n=1 Tax=Endozoicomonas sp. SCSIO W0465 TaxID=2918516 RepID=UPI002074F14D|nr:hypothetical protein [Endozoicomonas sp. SCSIO W0465]USE39195.1 hypothetical protein MJO57_14180 [Endozoicomonas sp. SCSIO W0465]
MMTTLKQYKAHKKALKAQIKEVKATLKRLEEELEAERQDMQHEEVDHLDEYFDKAEPHLMDVKKLGISAIEDFKKSVSKLMSSIAGSGKK